MAQTPDPQFLQDALQAVQMQRERAQNEIVELAAALQANKRTIAARDAKIAELETKLKALEVGEPPMPLTADGRDVHVIN